MGILTEEMQRVVREQRLGYVATVCPDGTPNLSPKGTTAVLTEGTQFEEIRATYGSGRGAGTQDLTSRIRAIVLVKVSQAAALLSPAYDTGLTEAEVVAQWDAYWQSLREQRATAGTGA